ncbi:unnamed protein product [Polarella glacialis]|uniref:Uncharacterized protein n=1 Tax=Polarella glacialis TaxID=89957 RepID=A0A813GZ42_POLGL|nr:unnamed protein product [Polarella glacialis]
MTSRRSSRLAVSSASGLTSRCSIWSPAGSSTRSFFVVSQNTMYELPEAGGEPTQVYSAPGLDLEGVAFDPAVPDRIIVAHEKSPSGLYSFNLTTSDLERYMDFDRVPGIEKLKPEALSFCPEAVCGTGLHFVVAGAGAKVYVIRAEPDADHNQLYQGTLVQKFDTTDVLCSLAGRCDHDVKITKLSGLSVAGDAINVINDDDTRELWVFKVSATSGKKVLTSAEIYPLPNVPGWEGISVREAPDGSVSVVLASDDMGFVSEFKLTSQGLTSRCSPLMR